MRPLAVHHVSINVDDVDAALDFYVGKLGLTERSDRPDFGFPGAWLDAGDQQVHLIGAAAPPDVGQHFALLVSDLDSVIEELRNQDIEVSDAMPVGIGPVGLGPVGLGPVGLGPVGIGPVSTGRQAFLKDPAGNTVELHQRRETSSPGPAPR